MRRMRRGGCLGGLVLGLALTWVSPAPAQESWDAVYLSGSKAGYVHTYVEPLKDGDRDLVRVRVDMLITIKRLDNETIMEFRYGTIEKPDGSVLRLDTRTLASTQEIRSHGDVVNDQMILTLDGSGQSQKQTIPWSPDVRGPYAVELSLSRDPMKVGQTRMVKMFIPDLNKICDTKLTAEAMEDVPLGGGEKRPLMRVQQLTSIDGKRRPEFDTTCWVDAAGQVLKSQNDMMGGIITYRTTREGAQQGGSGKLDQIVSSIIKVTHKITKPETRRNIAYQVKFKGDDLADLIPNDRRQTFQPGPEKTSGSLLVKTAGPDDGPAGPEQVDSEFLMPNTFVTSADPKVVELATKVVAGETDAWQRAQKINRWVALNLKEKNFKTAFAPASEVARNLTGDCTEHGVLTAAMCRAAGVPARVVVGLVYADHLGGFGYHMWNEVYVHRRWVAIDASFDQTSVDAVHIKLVDTSLAGVSPYEAFLPVVRVLSKLALEPKEIR